MVLSVSRRWRFLARINDFPGHAVKITRAGYRSIEVADQFINGIRALVLQGKPVAITEFGCTTHHGAANLGARGDIIVEWDGNDRPRRLKFW